MSKARDLADFISSPTVEATEIANGAITAEKLHTTLDLSSKTLTFANNHLSGDNIHGGIISDFQSTGIDDNANTVLLTANSGFGHNIKAWLPYDTNNLINSSISLVTSAGFYGNSQFSLYGNSAEIKASAFTVREAIFGQSNSSLLKVGSTSISSGNTVGPLSFYQYRDSDANGYVYGTNYILNSHYSDALEIGIGANSTTNYVSSIRVSNSGYVGIGNTNPQSTLTVGTSAQIIGSGPIFELTDQTPNATLGDIGDKGAKVLFRQDSSVQGQGTEIVWAGGADEGGERWAAISGWIRGNSVNGCTGDLQFSTKAVDTANTMSERMRICANGNIGINSSNPKGALSIVGTTIIASGDNSTSGISLTSNVTAGYAASITHSDVGIQFDTGSGSRNFTFETGRVFIGNTTDVDTTILQVNAPTGYTIASGFITDSAASTIQFRDGNTTGNFYVRIGSIGDDLAFWSGNSEAMRISDAYAGSPGRVGIGNTAPIHALHIHDANNDPNFRRMAITSTSNAGGNGGYRLVLKSPNGTDRGAGYYLQPGDTDASTYLGLSPTDSNYAMVLTRENKVGIGTTSPDYTLHVVGDSNLKRNDHYGSSTAEYSKWRQPGNAYVYDATNGTRYYYYKIGYFLSSTTSRVTIEYEAKDDVNYPGFVKGTIAIGHWAETSFNVQHDTSTVSGGGTPEVYVDNNHAVWLRFNGITWNSHWRYRIHQASGTFTPLDSWTLGTDYLDTANTSHTTPPAGSTGAIYPGENVRITWSGASPNTLNTPTKPTYNFYKELGKYRAGSQHHIHGTPGTGGSGSASGGVCDRFALSTRSRNTLTFSNSRITVPSSGLYLITFTTICSYGDARADTNIRINGSSFCNALSQEPRSGYTSSSIGYRYRGMTTIVQLASNDYIQFYHSDPYVTGNAYDTWQTASVTQIA